MTNFGALMRKRREELELNQEGLAAKASLSKGSISMIETGERAPSEKTVAALARALDLPAERLYDELEKDAAIRLAEKMARRRQAALTAN
jgi:transcriptional regulator with XRE-family HTH domain